MAKIDLKKDLKHLYSPSAKEVSVVDVPPMDFLMIDGSGDPNTSQEYAEAIEALYALAYALKFKVKKSKVAIDYAVMPLEGLWWTDDPAQFSMSNKANWKWTAMIMQPKYVTADLFAGALAEVKKKKDLTALDRVRFESYHEGLSAQIMHIGHYAAEERTIAKLHSLVEESGYKLNGRHHEIYLSDPRKSAPEKLKTVLRQPI